MNTNARMVFLSAALAVTLASGCAAAYASAIYETHADIYKAMTAGSYPDRPARPHHVRESKSTGQNLPKSPPVASSDIPNGKLTPDTRSTAP